MGWNCEYCGSYNTEGQCVACGGGTRILPEDKPMSEKERKYRMAILDVNFRQMEQMGRLWKTMAER